VAIVITFNQVHNGELGLASLTLFGMLYLAANLFTVYLDRRRKLSSPALSWPVIASTAIGILALVAQFVEIDKITSSRVLIGLLMIGFVVAEILVAKQVGRKTLEGKEAVITAVASAVMLGLSLGVDVGAVPLVGFFGAYHAILAVHLGISAATPKR
jgi:asparagine N-glycosylation enzyme membrane subunit Stt3